MQIPKKIQDTFQQELLALPIVEVSEIPSIDLYMDQVTTFMDQTLQYYKRTPDTKLLTKTMINNYTKAKILPPPVKKKYTPTHMMLLIMIFHLKSVLSIRDIAALFQSTLSLAPSESQKKILRIYEGFVFLQKAVRDHMQSTTALLGQDLLTDYDEETEEIMLLLLFAVRANTEKHFAEHILDLYF